MTKEEKEKLLDYMDRRIEHYQCGGEYAEGRYDAYKDVYEYVEDMPITEPKETNLEYYKDEIKDNIIHCHNNCYLVYTLVNDLLTLMGAKLSADTEKNIDKLLKLLLQTYEKPKYKLTQFEYDLLRTNDMSHDRKVGSFATYVNMKEVGYFKDIDFNLTIKDVLENCEVVE